MPGPSRIVLSTLNARYIHSSLGLRYLLANMGALRAQTMLCEFTISRHPAEVVDALLLALDGAGTHPGACRIVGFGVYIWNVQETTAVLHLLKARRPEIIIIVGGPEVSHELAAQEIPTLADYVITGWGDISFAKLCQALIAGRPPLNRVIVGEQPPLSEIALPYTEYSAADLAHRLLYVEASRGCPFKCEFCLSALDKTAWAFDPTRFLGAMDDLYQRGARHFKFVDRTFNLKIDTAIRILQFFLDRLTPLGADDVTSRLFVHFEVIPDHLPDRLKEMIRRFPPGVLQLEIGIQSFNVEVQQRIARRQDNAQSENNLRWLVAESGAHLHADLIFGLPGESLDSFARGFDRLYAIGPDEIQLGILKRLRGTPIARHSVEHGMLFAESPPYAVQQTAVVDALTMQRFSRFARYWDIVVNSGRFRESRRLLLSTPGGGAHSPFYAFLDFADWLWQRTGRSHALTPEDMVDALFDYLSRTAGWSVPSVRSALLADYVASGARASPQALAGFLPERGAPVSRRASLVQRQERHQVSGRRQL